MEALKEYIEGGRPAGRPPGGWIDSVDKAAKTMLKCKNSRRLTEDRDDWRRRIGEAKAQVWL